MGKNLLSELATNMTEPSLAIKAGSLHPAISENLGHLGILLSVLLEDKLALLVFTFVLSTTPVLSSLSYK